MTSKQEERIKTKIKEVKAALAADKRFWHGYYHDGGGLRYVPPGLYIQIGDYSGGLRYYHWFQKNFPDEASSSLLMFEWAIILFYKGKMKEAEKMLKSMGSISPFLIDKFFGRTVQMNENVGKFDLLDAEHQLKNSVFA